MPMDVIFGTKELIFIQNKYVYFFLKYKQYFKIKE